MTTKFLALALALLAGCGGASNTVDGPATVSAPMPPPLCTWTMSAPVASAESIWHPGAGVDCVAPIPAGDGRWQVGLLVDGYTLVFHVVEGDMDAEAGAFHLLEQGLGTQACTAWTGHASFSRTADAWQLEADVVCTDDGPPVRVALQLQGRAS